MKLLFDANLSPRLLRLLADLWPDSVHVLDVGLAADDAEIWKHAGHNGLVIVTKDSDFHHRSCLFGHPPKVVWITAGNCSTATVEAILRRWHSELRDFHQDASRSFLALDRSPE